MEDFHSTVQHDEVWVCLSKGERTRHSRHRGSSPNFREPSGCHRGVLSFESTRVVDEDDSAPDEIARATGDFEIGDSLWRGKKALTDLGAKPWSVECGEDREEDGRR